MEVPIEDMTCRGLTNGDEERFFNYLLGLSSETRSRFAPHPFDIEHVAKICSDDLDNCYGYITLYKEEVVAYIVAKKGYNQGELPRFSNYDFEIQQDNDYTLAPSVADSFQSKGVGNLLYQYVEKRLIEFGAKKLILWGGVQCSNQKAVNFYIKQGFLELGRFEYFGENIDMVKYL